MDAPGRHHAPDDLLPTQPMNVRWSSVAGARDLATTVAWQHVVLIACICIILLPACRNTPKRSNDHFNLTARSQFGSSGRELTEYQSAVSGLLSAIPRSSPFKVDVWTDKEVYEIGDSMTFFYRADRDVYVTLIDVGTGGRMQVVFPNKFSSDHHIAGGRVYRIPEENAGFTIYVQGPPGVERIKVIATESPFSILGEGPERSVHIFPQLDIRRAQEIKLVTKRLADELWAHAYTEIEIVPRGSKENGSGRTREIKPKPPEKPVDIIGVPGAKLERPAADQETGVSVVPIPNGEKGSEIDHQGFAAP